MTNLKMSILAGVLLALAFNGTAAAQAKSPDLAAEEANRALVIEFYDLFFNQHKVDEAAKMVAEDYKQHNPTVPDGKEPFVSYYREFFQQTPESSDLVARSAVDGDIVWLHVHSTNDEHDLGEAVIDIFRVKDGLIVEHWDVIQNVPETAEKQQYHVLRRGHAAKLQS